MTQDQTLIKSVSYSQEEILNWIIRLYCPEGFDLDPTYSKGLFYKKVPEPRLKFDLKPQIEGVQQADCTALPLKNNSLSNIVFDPPFIGGSAKTLGKIQSRFGFYKNVQTELWGMYHKALREFYRILKHDGILVFKCQDTIESSNQYLSHIEIINVAMKLGFYPKDLFILLAKHRMPQWNMRKQQHARKFHSYFLILKKMRNPVVYSPSQKSSERTNPSMFLTARDDKRQQIINVAAAKLRKK